MIEFAGDEGEEQSRKMGYKRQLPIPKPLAHDLLESRIDDKDFQNALFIAQQHLPDAFAHVTDQAIEHWRTKKDYDRMLETAKKHAPERLIDLSRYAGIELLKEGDYANTAKVIGTYAKELASEFLYPALAAAIDTYDRRAMTARVDLDLQLAAKLKTEIVDVLNVIYLLGEGDEISVQQYFDPITQESTILEPYKRLADIDARLALRNKDPERYDLTKKYDDAVLDEKYMLAKELRRQIVALPADPIPLEKRSLLDS